jgi:malonyl-CoA/methylmalonyl-CoA synthetase
VVDKVRRPGLQSLSGGTDAKMRLIERARRHAARTAIIDGAGALTYGALLGASANVAGAVLGESGDLAEQRIAFLVEPSATWVAVAWGIWRAGGIAVPLPLAAAKPEWEYLLQDSEPSALILDARADPGLPAIATAKGIPVLSADQVIGERQATLLPDISENRAAMILYTSGTTSRPKGVVTTHGNIAAQIETLVTAWEWSADDQILLCLPLHHVHGIINVLSCALWSGACCRMLPRFDAAAVWDGLVSGELTLFMAVPTVYAKLAAAREKLVLDQGELRRACRKLRLMVSGSSALPVSVLERWREITGHTLLERYGMTEIGMALSNPLHGERIPGTVGRPLPGVEVRLVDQDGQQMAEAGQIEVRGPGVFREYWRNPEATRKAFREGWFSTGDTAVVENGVYRILGRTTIDILKTGGHKISALEIEERLSAHPDIAECAVVGLPDQEWGERVAAAVVLRNGASLDLQALREWARTSLAVYKLPSRLLVLNALPRNAMGKVLKPQVAELFDDQ